MAPEPGQTIPPKDLDDLIAVLIVASLIVLLVTYLLLGSSVAMPVYESETYDLISGCGAVLRHL